jgi:hypothetical protein
MKRKEKRPAKIARRSMALDIVDSSSLTDEDWTTINMFDQAYARGGSKALAAAFDKLAKDPIRYIRIIGAFFPEVVREQIRDTMAENGITAEDLKEIIEKHERPTRLQ